MWWSLKITYADIVIIAIISFLSAYGPVLPAFLAVFKGALCESDREAFIVNTRLWSKRRREKTEKRQTAGTFDRVSASSQPRDAVGRDSDAITIRLSPSVVLLQSGYQLSNPLISVHSIYVRLSSRGDNDLPVWESARRCIVNRPRSASRVVRSRAAESLSDVDLPRRRNIAAE